MAVAGFTLSNQLTTLANDSANNPAQMASDVTQLQQTYDIVRAQVSGASSGSLGAAAATVDQLGGVVIDPRDLSVLPSQSGALSAEAPEIAVILGRIVLSPQQIALTAQQSIEWIATHAPTADGTNAAVHHSDLVITAEACGKWLASLNALGVMVAPSVMHESVASMASLLSLLHQSGPASVRSIVEQADVTVASLAALAGDFSGYGSGGAYQ